MKRWVKYVWLMLIALILIVSCDPEATQVELEQDVIGEYLMELCSDTTITQPDATCNDSVAECLCWFALYDTIQSGLFFKIDSVGTGEVPTFEDSLVWSYSAFEISTGESVATGDSTHLDLKSAIRGLQVALPRFKMGTYGTLLMTSSWAYGESSISTLGTQQPLGIEFKLHELCYDQCP